MKKPSPLNRVLWAPLIFLFGVPMLVACADPPSNQTDSQSEGSNDAGDAPAGPAPWVGAPADGVWQGGQAGFGESYQFEDYYAVRIAGPVVVLTEDEGRNVTVSSTFEFTRLGEVLEATRPLSGHEVLFWPGDQPQKTANEGYGQASLTCEDDQPGQGVKTTCTATFTPDSPAEVADFYWTVEGIRFGAWPSQTGGTSGDYTWVEVGRLSTTGAARTEPFAVDGSLRARYSFGFEPAPAYIYGELALRIVRDGECTGSWESRHRVQDQAEGVHDFGTIVGEYCGNVHLPDPNWDRGVVDVVFETLQAAR